MVDDVRSATTDELKVELARLEAFFADEMLGDGALMTINCECCRIEDELNRRGKA